MARKRMIDPEYWTDEKIANLSIQSRLFFIGLWNYADDEGVFKAHPNLLKSFVFPYDNIKPSEIEKYLLEIEQQNLIFQYTNNGQKYAIILNFRKHQVINKPQPSKLPPPSIQNRKYHVAIFKRDNWVCHICGENLEGNIVSKVGEGKMPSIDHLVPQSDGGGHLPSNLKTACLSCNKSRGNTPLPECYVNDTVTVTPEKKLKEVKRSEVKLSKEKIREEKGSVKGKTNIAVANAPADLLTGYEKAKQMRERLGK
jgi:hypothetical protein